MAKKTEENSRHNSVSESKINLQKKLREKIISIVNKKSNNKSQYISFYLIKLFEKNKFGSLTKNEILQSITELYSKNPKFFLTNDKENFKTKKSLCSTLVRMVNKISSLSKKNNSYKLNEKATLKYIKKYVKIEENSPKTPYKIYSWKNNRIKKESITDDGDEIKIKQEDIKIKEEEKEENNIFNEMNNINTKIKEEKNENEIFQIDENNISLDIEEEKNNINVFEIFNKKKLYDDFYLYLAEEGQFEQLQEKIDKFLEKYNNNKIEENNKFKLIEIISKIIIVKSHLNELTKNKKEYENSIAQIERKKIWIRFFLEIFYINIKTIRNMQHRSNLNDILIEAKKVYKSDKEKQNVIFDMLIKNIKEIRNLVMKSDKIKNDIIKELESISDYFKNSDIKYKNLNEFYELVENLIKGRYSFIQREDITEEIIEKYNKCVNYLEESLNLDKN
jgi:hypothetical protein